jgi:hypothetical protein
MRKLLPIILALIGLGAGVGAGVLLRPKPADVALSVDPCGETTKEHKNAENVDSDHPETLSYEYVKINNQFVIPIVSDGVVTSLVILTLSLEVNLGTTQKVYSLEPKLRDAFLQVLFDHANMGGFNGAFTDSNNMDLLRNALFETAHKILGDDVSNVLISDIIRQDSN